MFVHIGLYHLKGLRRLSDAFLTKVLNFKKFAIQFNATINKNYRLVDLNSAIGHYPDHFELVTYRHTFLVVMWSLSNWKKQKS